MLIMKCGKRETMEGIELPNLENTRMLGEQENYWYLGILEADTSEEPENYSTPSSAAKIV